MFSQATEQEEGYTLLPVVMGLYQEYLASAWFSYNYSDQLVQNSRKFPQLYHSKSPIPENFAVLGKLGQLVTQLTSLRH